MGGRRREGGRRTHRTESKVYDLGSKRRTETESSLGPSTQQLPAERLTFRPCLRTQLS